MSYQGTEFYSTSTATKVEALRAMVGDRVTVNGLGDILADIADGAGGGEYLSYGNEGGGRDYVSPMCDEGGRTWYAFLSVTDGVIVRTSYVSTPGAYNDRASDDVRTLAEVMNDCQQDARDAADGCDAPGFGLIDGLGDLSEPEGDDVRRQDAADLAELLDLVRANEAAEVAEAAAGDPLLDLVTAAAEAEAEAARAEAAAMCAPCRDGDHESCTGAARCQCIDMEHDDDE